MKNSNSISIKLLLALGTIALVPNLATAQTIQSAVRITQPVDAAKLAVLHGNTHPLARAEFDRGPAPASLSLDHMQLVLTRSPQQDAALNTLLAEQQDTNSPNYHKWLTPDEFGQQFGASDADIQTITAWLQSNGFQIDEVAKGKNIIEFFGNAGQVQAAFHTAIHKYVLASGEEHWANSSDPQIPAALATVVAGVNTLHNFPKHRASHTMPLRARANSSARTQSPAPDVTIVGGACEGSGTNCYLVGPADFATIYNVAPLYAAGIDGTGQTIGIVSDSDININDANAYRSTFGLPANPPHTILNNGTALGGMDPGVQSCSATIPGDECEAILDVEIAGGVAKGATINLYVAATTNAAFGGDLSAQYIVETPSVSQAVGILSYSYGACELDLGTTGNAFYKSLWSQAAGEGITVVVSTGDTGSANCEFPNASLFVPEPATTGLTVNGLASTPFNVAVGGTDFNNLTNPAAYFSATNSTGISSATGYIPETTYNDSCTNVLVFDAPGVYNFGTFGTAEAACNSSLLVSAVDGFDFVLPSGGGGGASNCTTSSTVTQVVNGIPTTITEGQVSSCGGGYAKPSFQTSLTPADGVRDLPDVSLFSGDGTIQNFYVICEADETGGALCNASNPLGTFSGGGGTSAAVQAFAGVVALINHKTGSRQGNINYNLYPLAATQVAANTNCNSSSSPVVTSGTIGVCYFYDVTQGTIAVPCASGSPNCLVNDTGDLIGITALGNPPPPLTPPAFNASVGYDQATGLGS